MKPRYKLYFRRVDSSDIFLTSNRGNVKTYIYLDAVYAVLCFPINIESITLLFGRK